MKREIRCKVCRSKTRRWLPVLLQGAQKRTWSGVVVASYREKWCTRCVNAHAVAQKAAARRDFSVLGALRSLLGRMFPRFGFEQRQAKRAA
jgi:hypothetical protein